jgi:hypothetical protein
VVDLLGAATPDQIEKWKKDFEAWCDRVSKKLENRAFFTRADQLHFDRLGFVLPVAMQAPSTRDPKRTWVGHSRCRFEPLRCPEPWGKAWGVGN